MRWLTCLIVLVISLVCRDAIPSPIVLSRSVGQVSLTRHLAVLRDPAGLLSLEDVAAPTTGNTFVEARGALNFGLTTDTIWLRIDVRRTFDAPAEWWLEVAPAYIGEVTLYLVGPDRNEGIVKTGESGNMVPVSSREFKTRHSTFRFSMDNFRPYTIYLRVRSTNSINVRASLWQPAFYAENNALESLVLGIYYGAFLLILSLGIMQWMLKRSQTDYWWMIYLAAEGFLMFRMNGLASLYFVPELPHLDGVAGIVSLSLMVWAGSRFGIHAFALESRKNRTSLIVARWIGNLALITGLARLFDASAETTTAMFLLAHALCVLHCVLSWRFLRSGHAAAVFYFVGIWFMSGCVILVSARIFGVIPAYQFVDYIWQSNLLIHTGLMSLGIVMSHRETLSEKTKAAELRASAETSLNLSFMQKRMVSLVSHEFRNALTMAGISMRAISKLKGLPVEVTQRLRNIARVHQQMRRVIDDFLFEERIQNSRVKVSYKKTDIHALVEDVVEFEKLLGHTHCISHDCSRIPRFLWMDEGILRLILTNLIDNAIKYSPERSKIILTGFYEAETLSMSVIDSGIGMTPNSLSQIFEQHFKVDMQSDGMGIGLYMVKMMLDAHDGDIDVVSTIEKGTKVNFRLKARCCGEEKFEKS